MTQSDSLLQETWQTTDSIIPSRPKRTPKSKPSNPILDAITSWHSTLPPDLLSIIHATLEELISTAPKRWVVYPPMILLPSGSFNGKIWQSALASHSAELWKKILEGISKKEGKGTLTHLAINSGIPLNTRNDDSENILRTPSGLITLHGNFGPALDPQTAPTEKDFKEAFWVTVKQNGITQVWAPRYTMFSRGNVKEKARLLGFHGRRGGMEEVRGNVAVDLYAGIGYFVFSYAALGMRVYGWEINAWSVEGLRRGAVLNGWVVRVVREGDDWERQENKSIVIFAEDNRRAGGRVKDLNEEEMSKIRHVNCGLLPTSEGSWETALELLRSEGWIHVHENVGINDVESRKNEIEGIFRGRLASVSDERQIGIEHVEFVKTFAPGVWHCVFDVCITNS